ncbi:MAG TPA: AtpZ/AtpI family protein [Candidatus Limnocylindria bacterium]|jgi:F0F1-type ATP synthase assembly protein I|nr:AtpZ/AtpI family protein [Candidatus Limnocylindria bacterium]
MNQNWGIALDLGIRLGAAVMIGFFGGLLLDGLFGTRPVLTLVGTAFGVAAAMYTIWDVARRAMKP